jgi:hypothetical protein
MLRTILSFALLTAACSDTPQLNITKTIGSEGGNVTNPGGSSVDVPSGALPTSTNITISKIDAPAPAGTVLVGSAFDFSPEGTTFAQPVTIKLPFDPALLPAGRTAASITIYTAPRGSTQYTALPTTVSGNSVQTTASHFTVYLPAAPVANSDGVRDMSVVSVPPDFATSSCSPSCQTGTSSCSCSASCSTGSFNMSCVPSGGSGFNCSCIKNGQTQSAMPLVLDCNNTSEVFSAFQQCLN